jgi:hypothetical protein
MAGYSAPPRTSNGSRREGNDASRGRIINEAKECFGLTMLKREKY